MYIAEITNADAFGQFLAAEAVRRETAFIAVPGTHETTFGDDLSITFGSGIIVFDGPEETTLLLLRRYVIHSGTAVTFYHAQDTMRMEIVPQLDAQSQRDAESFQIKVGIDDAVFLANARQVFAIIESWTSPKENPEDTLWTWARATYESNPNIQREARWSLGKRVIWFRSRSAQPFSKVAGNFAVFNRRLSDDGKFQAVLSASYAIVFKIKEATDDDTGQRWTTYRGRMAAYMQEEHHRDQPRKKARMIEICRALCGPDEDLIALDADAMIHDPTNRGAWMTVFTYDARTNTVKQNNEHVRI